MFNASDSSSEAVSQLVKEMDTDVLRLLLGDLSAGAGALFGLVKALVNTRRELAKHRGVFDM